MNDITLGGFSLKLLQEQKKAIQQDAFTFVAKGIKDATLLMESILDTADDEKTEAEIAEVYAAAAEAKRILEDVILVASVSGQTFYLPFSEDGYNPGDNPFSDRLYGAIEGVDLGDLIGVLENMEYDSKGWHSSNCY